MLEDLMCYTCDINLKHLRGFDISLVIYLFIFLKLFIYLFIYGCVGSSFLCQGFL